MSAKSTDRLQVVVQQCLSHYPVGSHQWVLECAHSCVPSPYSEFMAWEGKIWFRLEREHKQPISLCVRNIHRLFPAASQGINRNTALLSVFLYSSCPASSSYGELDLPLPVASPKSCHKNFHKTSVACPNDQYFSFYGRKGESCVGGNNQIWISHLWWRRECGSTSLSHHARGSLCFLIPTQL